MQIQHVEPAFTTRCQTSSDTLLSFQRRVDNGRGQWNALAPAGLQNRQNGEVFRIFALRACFFHSVRVNISNIISNFAANLQQYAPK